MRGSLILRRLTDGNVLLLAVVVLWATSWTARSQEVPPGAPPPATEGTVEEERPDIEVEVELELTGPARAAKPNAIDEVVVTAQKRAEKLQDVPISITALTDTFLEDTGTTSLLDIGRFAPNVSLNQLTDSRSTVIRIRGIGSDGTNAGIDPAVGTFVDGVYQGRTGLASSMDLADVERVEVLRGPQGTLYGKNTAAGAINVITKRPELNAYDFFYESVFGNYADKEIRGTVNVPMLDDLAAMRVTGYWAKRDGFDVNRYDWSEVNNLDRNGVRVKTLFQLTEDLELLVWADYGTEQTQCCVSDISSYTGPPSLDVRFSDLASVTGRALPTLNEFDRIVGANTQPVNSTRVIGTAAELNYGIQDYILTWLTAYRTFDSSSTLDGDFSTYNAVVQRFDEDFEQWSSELRLTSPSGERLEFVSGLYFYYQKDETEGQTGIGPEWLDASALGPIIRSEGGTDAAGYVSNFDSNRHETWSYAAFTQGTYNLLDQLSLTVGVRATYERKARVGSQLAGFTGADAGPFGPDRYADESFSVPDVSPMAALRWFPTLDSMAFVSVARGFKSGGFNQLRTTGGVNTQFNDEKATDVEAGFRSTWFDRAITLNATAFHTWYNDFQAQGFNGSAFSVTNAGKLRSYGVEVDGVLVPHPNLFTGFGVGYNPTVYDDFPGSPCTVEQDWQVNQDTPLLRQDCTQDLTGRPLDNAPEWSVSLFSQYEQGVGSVPRIGSLVGFVRADWSYQSRIYLQQDLDPHLQQPAYGLLNLRLGLKTEDEGWEVAFGVRNVTDTDYNVFGADVPIVNGFAVINGPPRQFMGTIRFRF